jgi:hypothetical protein
MVVRASKRQAVQPARRCQPANADSSAFSACCHAMGAGYPRPYFTPAATAASSIRQAQKAGAIRLQSFAEAMTEGHPNPWCRGWHPATVRPGLRAHRWGGSRAHGVNPGDGLALPGRCLNCFPARLPLFGQPFQKCKIYTTLPTALVYPETRDLAYFRGFSAKTGVRIEFATTEHSLRA